MKGKIETEEEEKARELGGLNDLCCVGINGWSKKKLEKKKQGSEGEKERDEGGGRIRG